MPTAVTTTSVTTRKHNRHYDSYMSTLTIRQWENSVNLWKDLKCHLDEKRWQLKKTWILGQLIHMAPIATKTHIFFTVKGFGKKISIFFTIEVLSEWHLLNPIVLLVIKPKFLNCKHFGQSGFHNSKWVILSSNIWIIWTGRFHPSGPLTSNYFYKILTSFSLPEETQLVEPSPTCCTHGCSWDGLLISCHLFTRCRRISHHPNHPVTIDSTGRTKSTRRSVVDPFS